MTHPKRAAAATKRDAPAKRRTQAERRAGTIRRLIDAATRVLVEVGYGAASVQRICERAGVSQGALFRHFPTREALLVAVGDDVGRTLLARYRGEFTRVGRRGERTAAAGDDEERLVIAMRLLRSACRSDLNQAWYELTMAARTNDALRAALAPASKAYHDDIEALARELLPDVAGAFDALRFAAIVDTIVTLFDGEALHRMVLQKPRFDEARFELLTAWIRAIRPARPLRDGRRATSSRSS